MPLEALDYHRGILFERRIGSPGKEELLLTLQQQQGSRQPLIYPTLQPDPAAAAPTGPRLPPSYSPIPNCKQRGNSVASRTRTNSGEGKQVTLLVKACRNYLHQNRFFSPP